MTKPGPDDEPDQAAKDNDGAPSEQPIEAKPWPTVDPEALEDKHFMVAPDVPGGEVAVTVAEGPIQKHGVPFELFSKLTEQVGAAIKAAANLVVPPVVIRAEAGNSMTIYFGDPFVEKAQTTIPYHPTWQGAYLIAALMGLDGDELFSYALTLGPAAPAYVNLAALVQSEGISLDWEVRGAKPTRLTHDRALAHLERLTVPPSHRERTMDIEGLLYRVIYDGPGTGRAGIKLSKLSPLPPRRRGRTVVVRYDDPDIERAILHELIGQAVVAQLLVVENAPLTSVLEAPPPVATVKSIRRWKGYEPIELWEGEEDGLTYDDEFGG